MVQVNGMKTGYHKNVWLSFVFQMAFGIAASIALGPLFDVYLFQIADEGQGNVLVGQVESVSGLVALALVIPVGTIVDTWDRVFLMRVSGVAGLITSVLGAFAIYYTSIPLWIATMVVNGVYMELGNSVCYALFADSVVPEQRPKATSTMGIVANIAQACGPLTTLFSMLYIGNSWTTAGLERILMFGMVVLNPICCVVMFFFEKAPFQDVVGGDDEGGEAAPTSNPLLKTRGAGMVPWLVALSDLITCIGAGMTIKYFNLYWKNAWDMSPTGVLAIAAVQPLAIAVFIKLLEKPSEMCGRAQASCACFLTGAFAFIVLAKVHNLPIALFFYFLRSGMANSVYPLNKSIMFDYTPSHTRGRWNAIETLAGSVWSGSAFIGGLLSDSHGYGFTFLITAGIYMGAMCVYSPLLWIVPRKSAPKKGFASPFMASPGNPAGKFKSPGPASQVMQANFAAASNIVLDHYEELPAEARL
eukprot:TRINITY_DN8910_c0_g2_i1.p1 TRINITY_DN8910_c0_g2~~TRINITY_DN8910_c0_g2_i1.p1  ORF type:complete len:473 (+),score=93.71 TRINITY_DN8910_c0_g2_i1:77-1495(+)